MKTKKEKLKSVYDIAIEQNQLIYNFLLDIQTSYLLVIFFIAFFSFLVCLYSFLIKEIAFESFLVICGICLIIMFFTFLGYRDIKSIKIKNKRKLK